jgi:hypothetical protein
MKTAANNEVKSPVLTCWKDIANYMGKGVRTVQRWEQEFGLPVRRPLGSNKKAVLARPADLDAWVALRCGARRLLPTPPGNQSDVALRLAALSEQIQRTCELRDRNSVLLEELQSALLSLRRQIRSLRRGLQVAPVGEDMTDSRCDAAFHSDEEEACWHPALPGTASGPHPFPEPTMRSGYNA